MDKSTLAVRVIGEGEIGGKANGLAKIAQMLHNRCHSGWYDGIKVDIPEMVVLGSQVFEAFMQRNKLWEKAIAANEDHAVAVMFQQAALPEEVVGELMGLVQNAHTPLAVRSSALLEDSLNEPFAGVYESKMIPNRSFDVQIRFRQLAEAVKFVYSSMFFRKAKSYFRVINRPVTSERMAVIIQEMVGQRCGEYYYPTLAGVIRSLNYYPTGNALPENGVVQLALGFGKTIVDGGKAWSYSPRYPLATCPYNSLRDLMNNSQTSFWAVNMGNPVVFDPTRETEYLSLLDLSAAEGTGNLDCTASTWDRENDRIIAGTTTFGPRLMNFAPLLSGTEVAFNPLITNLLMLAEECLGQKVEVEFAFNCNKNTGQPPRLGFLQVRPLAISAKTVNLPEPSADHPVLLATTQAVGNGSLDDVCDIVYVKPSSFDPAHTRLMAAEMESFNDALAKTRTGYILIGFGRWGSSDPWLGIPVNWSQISRARAIVEATLPQMNPDFSQGSHFFHNLFSHGVLYYSAPDTAAIDWEFLDSLTPIYETEYLRHVRLDKPLLACVDGRLGRGGIWR